MLDVPKDFLHRSRYDAALRVTLKVLKALHSKGLPSTGLTICQDRCIVTFKDRLNSWPCSRFIYEALSAIGAINIVKTERMIRCD